MKSHSALAQLRYQAGLSRSDLASACGISKDHLARIERGTDVPSLFCLVRIAYACNVSLDTAWKALLAGARYQAPKPPKGWNAEKTPVL